MTRAHERTVPGSVSSKQVRPKMESVPETPPASGFRFSPQSANLWCERRSGFPFSSYGSPPPLSLLTPGLG